MDLGIVRGLLTVLVVIAFIGVVLWAYSSKRRRAFEDAARLPLEEDGLDSEGNPARAERPEAESS